MELIRKHFKTETMKNGRRTQQARCHLSFWGVLAAGACVVLCSLGLMLSLLYSNQKQEATSRDATPMRPTLETASPSPTSQPSAVVQPFQQPVAEWDTLEAYQAHVLDNVKQTLGRHAFNRLTPQQREQFTMADYFEYLQHQDACKGLPVITSMANVFSELYWQLIENYIYTMVKFDLSDCALMVCVSDSDCMRRCQEAGFPCIDFHYVKYHNVSKLPSALEQIAALKLYHIPLALRRGVNILMLDLDVGFLISPRNLIDQIEDKVDAYVQKDISYVMNRSAAGWRTWFTVPLPNIGIFFARGNDRTVSMLDSAWQSYLKIEKPGIKERPGKDQNKVEHAMLIHSIRGKFRWRYFPATAAVLLDMIYKFNNPLFELGGRAAHEILVLNQARSRVSPELVKRRATMGARSRDVGQLAGPVTAVHTTCYEQKIKVMGLKAANAYWNPFYYDASRRTLTKPLVFRSVEELQHELRSLFYLAIATNRSVILPNVLGNDGWDIVKDVFEDSALWPSFRLPFFLKGFHLDKQLTILEPGFYYRVARDYFEGHEALIPSPHVVVLPATKMRTVRNVEEELLLAHHQAAPRLVLSVSAEEEDEEALQAQITRLQDWAEDSVGGYRSYAQEVDEYVPLPRLQYGSVRSQRRVDIAESLVQNVRLCKDLFIFDRGNRSCFNKCD